MEEKGGGDYSWAMVFWITEFFKIYLSIFRNYFKFTLKTQIPCQSCAENTKSPFSYHNLIYHVASVFSNMFLQYIPANLTLQTQKQYHDCIELDHSSVWSLFALYYSELKESWWDHWTWAWLTRLFGGKLFKVRPTVINIPMMALLSISNI